MKVLSVSVLTFVLIFLFFSCETDFDTTTDWQDITVVYGLLDQKNPNQYLKINKAFLGEGNALVYAAEADSSNYPYDLDVWLEEWTEDGDSLGVSHFETTMIYDKEPGQFYYPNQLIYNWIPPAEPVGYEYIVEGGVSGTLDTVDIIPIWLNDESVYRLKIRNPHTGKMITSESVLIKDFEIEQPNVYGLDYKFVPEPVNPKEIRWTKEKYFEGRYELEMRFNYSEVKTGSTDTIRKYITLVSTEVYPQSAETEVKYYYWDDNFFTSCDNLIPYSNAEEENQVKDRLSGDIAFIISVGAEDYTLYMQVYEPSTSIVQEKPNFTNIENGIGLFSSRFQKSRSKNLATESVAYLKELYPELKFKF
jgi:hypothetical protein